MAAERMRRRHRARRVVALGVVLAIALVSGYWFWLRDSSLVAVEEVEVRGATANAGQIQSALEQASREMTTLHVDDDELARAVSGFPTVASIAAESSIPHKLTVTVTERLPVGVVKVEGEPVGVSSDGLLLTGLDVSGQGLPPIEVDEVKDGRLGSQGAAQAAILAGATEELRERVVEAAWDDERGEVVVELENAPEARFGDGSEAERKWEALAAVLLSDEFAGGSYVDVSVPERPVSGG
jgi:cell division protein FtsQ